MILGYKDRRTELFASGAFVAAFQGFEKQAAKRLSILNAAPSLATLSYRAIVLKLSRGRGEDSIPSESIGSGVSALPGPAVRGQPMSRL